MEPKILGSLLTSLVSQTLVSLLLLLLNPPSSLPLPLHLLSSSSYLTSITSSLSLLPPNPKRHKTHHQTQENQESASPPIPRNPDQFKLLFRMSSSSFQFLSGLLDPLLPSSTLALALSRLALGTPYTLLPPSARSSTKLLCRTLSINFRFHLSFPSDPSPHSFPLPGCRGALASTRLATAPSRTISAQIVAGADSRILSIAAGFRGERGDAEVLRRSSLYRDCEEGKALGDGQYFVAGGGYPLRTWLMVPFDNAGKGTVEEEFNRVHEEMMRPVKRAVASLRGWGVMRRLEEEEDGRMVAACIGTCAILHNLLLMREDYTAMEEGGEEEGEGSGEGEEEGIEEEEEEEECFVEEKACVLRSTLAVQAREVRNS